ncbi:MAG: TetR family transcriptional regulator [Proteobacteria bacterium]|nr:MAG: TetR family transcriptional regulator [Pseudomonadota bacterium]
MSQPSLATPRARRTQEERSAETRTRLLDATIESLIEVGYASTTTTAVCERAGVSRGAQVHHFPRKQDLVVAAVAHLAAQHVPVLRERAAALPPAASGDTLQPAGFDRLGAVIELVAETFGGPLFTAALELWIAARTDAELHRALVPFERGAGRGLVQLWREIAGDLAAHPRFDAVLELTMHLARGMALQKILRDDDGARRRAIDVWRTLAEHALSDAGGRQA